MLRVEIKMWKQKVGLGLRPRYGHSRLHAADEEECIPPVGHFINDRRNEDVHFDARREDRTKIKTWREHARDRDRRIIELDGLTGNRRVARKLALPKEITEQDRRTAIFLALFRREQPPECRSNAKRLKEIAGHSHARDGLRLTAARQLVVGRAVEGHVRRHACE